MTTPARAPDRAPRSGRGGRRMSGRAIAAMVIAALALIFVLSNLGDGALHFLGFAFTMPVWIWFLVVLVAGVVVGSLFPWFLPRRRRR